LAVKKALGAVVDQLRLSNGTPPVRIANGL
jgi:hypothetical protein